MNTWIFDESHSAVGFATKHLMISTVRGRFKRFEGTIDWNEADPAASAVNVTVQTASIDTDWGARDDHLRSPDFLDSATHPTMTFRSTSVEPTGERTARVHGELTIRGETRPVTLATELIATTTGMSGERRAAFEARTTIDREQWGLTWNMGIEAGGVVVGKEIRIELEITATQAAVEDAPAATAARAA